LYKLRRLAHFTSIALLLTLDPALNACGPTPTALGQATLIRRDTAQTFPVNFPAEVQVTSACQKGEHLVSGGYGLNFSQPDPDYAQPSIGASYPSDATGAASSRPTAWTVLLSPPSSGGTITASAECLKGPFPLSVQAAMATMTTSPAQPAYTVQVTCPSGTLLTGGGFKPYGDSLGDLPAPYHMGMDSSYPSDISPG
jgi:hypothetical protein